MPLAENATRLDHIRESLKLAAQEDSSAFCGLELWSLSYERLMAAKLCGLPLIEVKKTAHSCCSANAASGG